MLSFIKRPIRRRMEGLAWRLIDELSHDVALELQLQARREAAAFAVENLGLARGFAEWMDLARHCVAQALERGLVCECGVYKGRSANRLARMIRPRVLHGFDSFEGLPEAWRPGFGRAAFTLGRQLPKVEGNVVLHAGWFDATLPSFRQEYKEPLALLHVDCDLYASTQTVLREFSTAIVPGTIILFDEFFNYPGWKDHEHKAFLEWTQAANRRFEYIGYNHRGEQVAIRVLS